MGLLEVHPLGAYHRMEPRMTSRHSPSDPRVLEVRHGERRIGRRADGGDEPIIRVALLRRHLRLRPRQCEEEHRYRSVVFGLGFERESPHGRHPLPQHRLAEGSGGEERIYDGGIVADETGSSRMRRRRRRRLAGRPRRRRRRRRRTTTGPVSTIAVLVGPTPPPAGSPDDAGWRGGADGGE